MRTGAGYDIIDVTAATERAVAFEMTVIAYDP